MTPDALLKYAFSLQNRCTEQVGHLTKPALREYNERGQIIPATENGELCGFLTYFDGRNGNRPRNDPATVRIHQIAVQDDARRILHGTGLISRLIYTAHVNKFNRLALWCATDLQANAFWRALGFTDGRVRIGGTKRGRLHQQWYMDVPQCRLHGKTPCHDELAATTSPSDRSSLRVRRNSLD